MGTFLSRIWADEDGQGMVEYGLIIAGIALAVIVAIWALRPTIMNMFDGVKEAIEDPQGAYDAAS